MEVQKYDDLLVGNWIRRSSLLKSVRIGELREAVGADRRDMGRYTKDRPRAGKPDIPPLQTMIEMAIVLDRPVEEAVDVLVRAYHGLESHPRKDSEETVGFYQMKAIATRAEDIGVPTIRVAQEVAGLTVEDAVEALRQRGYGKYVEAYSHELIGEGVDTADV